MQALWQRAKSTREGFEEEVDLQLYMTPSFEEYGGKGSQDSREDCDCQLEHDEESLGDGALRGKGQDILVTGNSPNIVRGSVEQPELLRAAKDGIAGEIPASAIRVGVQGGAVLAAAPVAEGKRVSKREPAESDEGRECNGLQSGREHSLYCSATVGRRVNAAIRFEAGEPP